MYTRDEVREMIYNYKSYNNIIELKLYDYDSTSTAQYGIESAMPKAKGLKGDKLYIIVANRDKALCRNIKLIERMQFIDENEKYIEDEVNYHLLQMTKKGFKHKKIMEALRISRGTFYKKINEIVDVLMDSQQERTL